MSIDLNFWKYKKGVSLDNAIVYQKACCENETMEELEALPIADILKDIAASFHDWNPLDQWNYERKEGPGSFQITTTPQTVRVDCYSMAQADMKRFSSIMSKFGCPLYDPQLGVRFDKIIVFLRGEAAEYKTLVEQEISRLLPRLEIETRVVDWDEYVRLSKTLAFVQIEAYIHRAKTMTKAIANMKFGSGWANRPCQCKTAQLEDKEKATQRLSELLQKAIGRVVDDFWDRTYYE